MCAGYCVKLKRGFGNAYIEGRSINPQAQVTKASVGKVNIHVCNRPALTWKPIFYLLDGCKDTHQVALAQGGDALRLDSQTLMESLDYCQTKK